MSQPTLLAVPPCAAEPGATAPTMPAVPAAPTVGAAPAMSGTRWHERLSLLLESTGEGIYCVDTGGRCMYANRAAAAMLGYTPSEMAGRNMHALVHHTHADGSRYAECDCHIFNAFRAGHGCRIDSEVMWRADGSSFHAEYSSHPVIEDGVVLGAVVTFVDISERQRAQELLRQANDLLERRVEQRTRALSGALAQLRELSAYLDSVREEERTRIAREIHDELGSLLVALKMDVNWLAHRLSPHPEWHAKCRRMGSLIDNAVDNVGRIMTDLRPSILDHQGLWAALEWQAQEFAESAELRCVRRFVIDDGIAAPEGAQAIAVFRIFQEMLSNVARHAQARSVRISVQASVASLRIEVRDDGRGASPAAFDHAGAYGVLGMRERASHFGGTVQIDSRPGAGTAVRLTMPVGLHARPAARHCGPSCEPSCEPSRNPHPTAEKAA
jgi:PAS domain S-box-containing protein